MTLREYIQELYRVLMGREADDEGLRYWMHAVEQSGNAIDAFAGLFGSEEYRQRHAGRSVPDYQDLLGVLIANLEADRTLNIVDVGAQRLTTEEHIYQPLLTCGIPYHITGFDPLADRLRERSEVEEASRLSLLPYAIGDGRPHTLYINNVDSTSSLYPLDEDSVRRFGDLSSLHTVRTESVETRRLDDVLSGDRVDFLKLDIQGFELHALEAALATLRRTAVVHCEVEFTPIYSSQPLFYQVHDFLARHDFVFVDYATIVRLPLIIPSGKSFPETMIFGDGIFLRKPNTDDKSLLIVQALIALLVYRKPGLAEWLGQQAGLSFRSKETAPVQVQVAATSHATPEKESSSVTAIEPYRAPLREFSRHYSEIEALPVSADDKWRIAMTSSCSDCDAIAKVDGAGTVMQADGCRYQLMHNGVRVLEDCYYGRWMTELIRLLRGHHEPQEERVFYELLKHIKPGATMVELGCFWAYYSLWFQRQIAGAKNVMVEPDPNNLAVGRKNFALNGSVGKFIHASVGFASAAAQPFVCESDGVTRDVPSISVDDLVRDEAIDRLELLLVDTQGAECAALEGAAKTIASGKLRFVLLSTHHHSISHDPILHQRCLHFLRDHGAHIIVEHSVSESYSGDGLIAASFFETDAGIAPIEVSRNRASTSLFRECEFDLAEANDEIARLRSRPR